ncbi:MAG: hypothetical protein K1X86_03095 [Ignavibacteria bacterium]|nr:hypothetical protein [Ignavibacteria bacterium]
MSLQLPVAIIAILVFSAFLIAIIRIFTRESKEKKEIQNKLAEYDERFRRAVFASAVIISITRSAAIGRSEMRVDIRLEVKPTDGEPYSQSVSWMMDVSELSYLKQGETIQVKIDADDSAMVYPTFAKSKYWIWS